MFVQWETPLDYSQYQNIINRMPIGLWVVVRTEPESGPTTQIDAQPAIQIAKINPSAAHMLGTSTEPLSALGTQEVLQHFLNTNMAALCLEVMRTGTDRQEQEVRYRKDDQILHLTADILHAEAHSCVVLFQNETAQKLASERLVHGQRVAHIGDWDWKLPSDTIYFSDELARIFGISSTQLPLSFERTLSLVHPDDLDTVRNAVKQAISTLEPFSIYFRVLRADQTERAVHSIGHVEVDEHQQPIRLWGTTQDVTERWLAEKHLRTSEARLRAITDSAHDAMISFTARGEITFWNPGAVNIFGVESKIALEMSIQDFIGLPPATATPAQSEATPIERAVDSGQWSTQSPQEVTAHRYDGTAFPAEMSLGSWSTNGSTFYTAILRDITKRRRAEAELQEFARQLETSNRELQDFAYIASHDLQEPLRKINAFSDRLRSKYGATLDDTALDYLSRMQNAAQRMQVLINDLLTLSRITTKGRPFDRTDLNAVAHAVLEDLETTIQQSEGQVIVAELPQVEADPLQMRQLFQNLISNALKFRRSDAPPIVRIYSDVQESEGQPPHIPETRAQMNAAAETATETTAETADETADKTKNNTEGQQSTGPSHSPNAGKMHRICFSDNGIGFDEKYLDRIFQPFQRLHGRNEYVGTGMGLAICRKIAERHSGTISAQSTADAGTTFVVTLPEKQARNSSDES